MTIKCFYGDYSSHENEQKMLEFGKYESRMITTNSFYKPHTRIVKI